MLCFPFSKSQKSDISRTTLQTSYLSFHAFTYIFPVMNLHSAIHTAIMNWLANKIYDVNMYGFRILSLQNPYLSILTEEYKTIF